MQHNNNAGRDAIFIWDSFRETGGDETRPRDIPERSSSNKTNRLGRA
jgi:hypothetical protein